MPPYNHENEPDQKPLRDLTDREVRIMADALLRQEPFIKDLTAAFLRQGGFVESMADKIASNLLQLIGDQLSQCSDEMSIALKDHEKNCAKPENLIAPLRVTLEALRKSLEKTRERLSQTENKDDKFQVLLNEFVGRLRELEEESNRHTENWTKHKAYHKKNEPFWGLIAMAKKKIHWLLIALALTGIFGYSLQDVLLKFLGFKTTQKQSTPKPHKAPMSKP